MLEERILLNVMFCKCVSCAGCQCMNWLWDRSQQWHSLHVPFLGVGLLDGWAPSFILFVKFIMSWQPMTGVLICHCRMTTGMTAIPPALVAHLLSCPIVLIWVLSHGMPANCNWFGWHLTTGCFSAFWSPPTSASPSNLLHPAAPSLKRIIVLFSSAFFLALENHGAFFDNTTWG